jgi:hypothetical protein
MILCGREKKTIVDFGYGTAVAFVEGVADEISFLFFFLVHVVPNKRPLEQKVPLSLTNNIASARITQTWRDARTG